MKATKSKSNNTNEISSSSSSSSSSAVTTVVKVKSSNNRNQNKNTTSTRRQQEEDTKFAIQQQQQLKQHDIETGSSGSSLSSLEKISNNNNNKKDKDKDNRIVAAAETKKINILRGVVLVLLLSIATLAIVGVYLFTVQNEQQRFEDDFSTNANSIIDSFHDAIERRLGAVSSMSNSITSFAISTNQSFPFVTMPHMAVLGADLRIQAAALIIHWMPLVTDDTRLEWEEYALENRFQIDETFVEDTRLRLAQDEAFGFGHSTTATTSDSNSGGGGGGGGQRMLQDQQQQQQQQPKLNLTMLDDGTGYHPKLWTVGDIGPRGDLPYGEDNGPYLPIWQRSPMNPFKQKSVNIDFGKTNIFNGVLDKVLQTSEAIMHKAVVPLQDEGREKLAKNLAGSQFRYNAEPYMDDPITFLAYPVFDSFELESRQVTGLLALNVYWRRFFTQILPVSANGYICIIENSYNQTLSYKLDGPDATFLGEGDVHDPQYDYLEESADINEFVQQQASPETRSYTTVPLNKDFGKYRLRIYPTEETHQHFQSNKPYIYGMVVLVVFLLTLVILTCLDRVVAQRQRIVMDRVVKTAEDAAAFERDLNAFLAHEVRNPIAAALSAHGFVAEAVANITTVPPSSSSSEEEQKIEGDVENNDNNNNNNNNNLDVPSLQADVAIIGSSLYFIDDFLRSMLDIHASAENKLHVHLAPIDLLKDVLDPVRSILHQRDTGIDVQVDCPENVIITTDCLRLKQIIINLGRNSTKFTTIGFVRFRAAVVNNLVELYVEDSGSGIPIEKRGNVFQKFQTSLDELNQGTGLGLSLCEKLIKLMKGTIYLDDDYDSGIPGSPGTRFVIQLNTAPKPPDSILDSVPIEEEALPSKCLDRSSCTGSTLQMSFGAAAADDDHEERCTPELAENLSILFVDDDTVLRKLFSRAVKKVAPTWKISEAASGEAAIQLVEESPEEFDLIFMDQYMTSTEKQLLGTETIKVLRSKGVDCTICGLSANDMEEGFLNAGADGFSLKPLPCKPDAMRAELVRITHSL